MGATEAWCGCCGRDTEEPADLWCAVCARHVDHDGPIWHRTWFDLTGNLCPMSGATP